MSAVESWFAPAAVAEPLPTQRPRRRPAEQAVARKPRARKQRGRNFRVRGSLVWMALLALMLVGVVAVNVAVLRAHVSVNDLDTKVEQLRQGNAKLASHYASMTAAPRIDSEARDAKLIPAQATTLIDMGSGK